MLLSHPDLDELGIRILLGFLDFRGILFGFLGID